MKVSAVIPTRGRPELLARAIRSIRSQTLADVEIVVVVDGPDPATEALLADLADAGLRAVVNPASVGPSAARNIGVGLAQGRWIAFLDDDDEWLPTKLERQLGDLEADGRARVVGLSQLITRQPGADYIAPERPPRPGEPLSDYLFIRRGWFRGGGRAQTSTIVAPRELLLDIPFDPDLRCYEDTDWMLRIAAADVPTVWTMTPLSIWYTGERRATLTTAYATDWEFVLAWCRARRGLMTPRSYAAVVLERAGGHAAAARAGRGVLAAIDEARRGGRPSLRDIAVLMARWAITPNIRRLLRARLAAQRGPTSA